MPQICYKFIPEKRTPLYTVTGHFKVHMYTMEDSTVLHIPQMLLHVYMHAGLGMRLQDKFGFGYVYMYSL